MKLLKVHFADKFFEAEVQPRLHYTALILLTFISINVFVHVLLLLLYSFRTTISPFVMIGIPHNYLGLFALDLGLFALYLGLFAFD